MPSIELRCRSGRLPEQVLVELQAALTPNESDMSLAGQLVRSEIRLDCERGVDVHGVPFHPYSTDHPYYYNAGTCGGKYDKETKGASKRMNTRLTKAGVTTGGVSSTGRTVKFASYAAFKAAFGRPNVDLMGVQAPHMLDAIVVVVNGHTMGGAVGDDETFSEERDNGMATSPATQVQIGIYDTEAAERASGHNNGTKTLPQRQFFGISDGARVQVRDMLQRRLIQRARRALRGGA